MLEMLIALLLVGACALPLAHIPMRALQQEYKSAWRLQAQRLADVAFADIKEKLHKKEIPWKEIISPSASPITIYDKTPEVALAPDTKRKFNVRGTIHSVGKKTPQDEEWRLITCQITIEPVEKKLKLFRGKIHPKRTCTFNYQLTLSKSSGQIPLNAEPPSEQPPPVTPPKKQAQGSGH